MPLAVFAAFAFAGSKAPQWEVPLGESGQRSTLAVSNRGVTAVSLLRVIAGRTRNVVVWIGPTGKTLRTMTLPSPDGAIRQWAARVAFDRKGNLTVFDGFGDRKELVARATRFGPEGNVLWSDEVREATTEFVTWIQGVLSPDGEATMGGLGVDGGGFVRYSADGHRRWQYSLEPGSELAALISNRNGDVTFSQGRPAAIGRISADGARRFLLPWTRTGETMTSVPHMFGSTLAERADGLVGVLSGWSTQGSWKDRNRGVPSDFLRLRLSVLNSEGKEVGSADDIGPAGLRQNGRILLPLASGWWFGGTSAPPLPQEQMSKTNRIFYDASITWGRLDDRLKPLYYRTEKFTQADDDLQAAATDAQGVLALFSQSPAGSPFHNRLRLVRMAADGSIHDQYVAGAKGNLAGDFRVSPNGLVVIAKTEVRVEGAKLTLVGLRL